MSSLRRCHHFPSRWLGRKITSVVERLVVVMADAPVIISPASAAAAAPIILSPSQTKIQLSGPIRGGWKSSGFDFNGIIVTSEQRQLRTSTFTFQHPFDDLKEQHQSKNMSTFLSPLQSRGFAQHARRGTRCPDMRNCGTIAEIVQVATDHLEVMTTRDLSAFWTLASKLLNNKNKNDRVQEKAGDQLENILVHTLEEIGKFGYRDLAQTTLGIAKIVKSIESRGKRPSKGPRQILHNIFIGDNSKNKQFIFNEIAAASMPIFQEFDPRHLSNLIYAFGLADYALEFQDGSTFFDVLALEVVPRLETFNAQDISNMLWAYANVKASNPQLFLESGDIIVAHQNLENFYPQALSNIVWAYATVDGSHPKLFKKVADHIITLNNLGDFNPQDLCNIVWAYATAEEHPKIFKKVADHIGMLDNLVKFKSQELSNMVWAYATAEESHPKLFKKVADHIVMLDNLIEFNPQDLSNIVWAYATAEEQHPKIFKKVADHIIALNNLDGFKPQALSNIVWACATAEEPHPKLFKKVADHIGMLDNLIEFKSQALSNTVWAYATAEVPHPKLFKKVADHVVSLDSLGAFNPQALSNTVWAYTTAKESHPKLFKKLADAIITKQNEFTSQNNANCLWAYATNGQIDQHLFKSMAPMAAALLRICNSQTLANIAWSYAVANESAPSLFNQDFINACLEKEDEFTVEVLCQLHQWHLWQEELKSDIRLPPSLQTKCYDTFVSRGFHPSALQDDVISELSSIGLQPEEEKLTERGYRLDALVEVNGNKIGIEVDGPTHFVGRKPTGSTILKHRQVTNVEGIRIVSVPYWEWNKLRKDRSKKQQYLRNLLGLN